MSLETCFLEGDYMKGTFLAIRKCILILLCSIPLLNLSVIMHLRFSPRGYIRRTQFSKRLFIYSLVINGLGLLLLGFI